MLVPRGAVTSNARNAGAGAGGSGASGTAGRKFGISPHQYLTSRRVDLARRPLLDGMPPSLAAAAAGFYDRPHLTRHFKRVLGTTPPPTPAAPADGVSRSTANPDNALKPGWGRV